MVCDQGINLFSLYDTAFLNRLAAEAILWEKQILRTLLCYRVSGKYTLNSHPRVMVGVLLLSQSTCP